MHLGFFFFFFLSNNASCIFWPVTHLAAVMRLFSWGGCGDSCVNSTLEGFGNCVCRSDLDGRAFSTWPSGAETSSYSAFLMLPPTPAKWFPDASSSASITGSMWERVADGWLCSMVHSLCETEDSLVAPWKDWRPDSSLMLVLTSL